MKKSQVFSPDVRNLGGRKLLVNQIYNHRVSLGNIKPIIGSFDSPHSMAKKGKKIVSFKEIEDKQNLIIMHNKISKVKKSIDNNKPVSFNLIRQGQPGGATFKQYQFMQEEHYKNLLAQKKQIESFGSMNDRKKNINDFIAYPPKFFRRLNNNQMHQYNQFQFSSKSLQSGSQSQLRRPQTANAKQYCNNSNIFEQQNSATMNIQDSKSQILQQDYNQLSNEQQQMFFQQNFNQVEENPHQINNQEIYLQQISQGSDGQNIQNYQQQENKYKETVKKNLQQFNGLNIQNNSVSSAGYALISPSATTATAGFSSQLKASPFQVDNQQNSFNQSSKNNMQQSSPQINALMDQIVNKSASKQNSQSQKKMKSAGAKSKQNLSSISNINKSAHHSHSDKSKKGGNLSTNKKESQKSLTIDIDTNKKYMDEEQKWITIIEEVPQLEDIREESLKVLKMHLINMIIEFRLYRLTEYESMKQIFIEKNKGISLDLVEEIFSEIIEALNE
ncbi:hypothetical protein ABPG72_002491 [Tetrahymena utriculariae]